MKRISVFLVLVVLFAGCKSSNYTPEDDYLYNLCKIWGFLKYHHPEVAEGKYDWDQELFAMLAQTDKAVNRDKRNALLAEWVGKLGPVTAAELMAEDTADCKQAPDYGWIDQKEFGSQLAGLLTDIRDCQPADSNCYVNFDLLRTAGQPLFENEKSYADIEPWEDYNYRMLTLFRAWNAIEYLFPYKYLTNQPWDNVLREYIPLCRDAKTKKEFKKMLALFNAEIGDGHAYIYSGQYSDVAFEPLGIERKGYIPCHLEYVEGKYVVTRPLDQGGLERGDVLVKIDQRDVDSLVNAWRPYFSAPNDDYYYDLMKSYISFSGKDSVVLTVSRDDKISEIKTRAIHFGENPRKSNTDGFRMFGDSISYIDVGNFGFDQIDTTFEKISSTKGLILDMRKYPKEFMIYWVGYYLIDGTLPFVKCALTSYDRLGSYNNVRVLTVGENNPYYYKGRVVLLVNVGTISQGEFTTMAWRQAPNATVIGSQTAGADGDVSCLPLPGNFFLRYTGNGIYYPDGGETQRVGIRIDEQVRPTIRGIREGRDELVERAIEIINQ